MQTEREFRCLLGASGDSLNFSVGNTSMNTRISPHRAPRAPRPYCDALDFMASRARLARLGWLLGALALPLIGAPAHAQDSTQSGPNFTVNQLGDADDGACTVQNCTLREAIFAASDDDVDSTIDFSQAVFGESRQTITLGGTGLTLSGDGEITITAPDVGVDISGANQVRVLRVQTDATLSGLTIRNGSDTGNEGGGGILLDSGSLKLEFCTVRNNSAVFGGGIGVTFGSQVLTVENSTLSNNDGTLGGGLYTSFGGTYNFSNCTIAGNTSQQSTGGLLFNDAAQATLESCTITGNSSGVSSRGDNSGNLTQVHNSIIAGNTGFDVQFSNGNNNTFQSNGFNLIGSGNATGAFNEPSDTINVSDPKLAELAFKGGKTQTVAPLFGSPAIDAGDSALTSDQRGVARPFDVVNVDNATDSDGSDIGAFEFVQLTPSADDKTGSGASGETIVVPLSGIDPAEGGLTYKFTQPPTSGSADIRTDGDGNSALFYTSEDNFGGEVIVKFTATGSDGGVSDEATATFTITQLAPPTANDVSASGASGQRFALP